MAPIDDSVNGVWSGISQEFVVLDQFAAAPGQGGGGGRHLARAKSQRGFHDPAEERAGLGTGAEPGRVLFLYMPGRAGGLFEELAGHSDV